MFLFFLFIFLPTSIAACAANTKHNYLLPNFNIILHLKKSITSICTRNLERNPASITEHNTIFTVYRHAHFIDYQKHNNSILNKNAIKGTCIKSNDLWAALVDRVQLKEIGVVGQMLTSN